MNNNSRKFLEHIWHLRQDFTHVYLRGKALVGENRISKRLILLDHFVNIENPACHKQINSWHILHQIWERNPCNIGFVVHVWDKRHSKWLRTTISDSGFGPGEVTGSQLFRWYTLETVKSISEDKVPPFSPVLRSVAR